MRQELGQATSNIDYLSRIGLTANLGHSQSTNAGIRLKVSASVGRIIHPCYLHRMSKRTMQSHFRPRVTAMFY